MKKKVFVRGICFWGVLFFAYVALLIVGHIIPVEWVFHNVEKSYEELDKIGLYYDVVEGAQWDNWTDTYFLNVAITNTNDSLIKQAISNSYITSAENDRRVLDDLAAAVNVQERAGIASYSRYWAGNMTLYKFLLIFMPISGIRNVLLIITIILFTLAIINIYKILGYKGIIPFIFSILACKYIPLSMCLTFFSDIFLTLIMINICAWVYQKKASWKKVYFLFTLIGSLCIYLGYWGFPLISLGIPLTFINV